MKADNTFVEVVSKMYKIVSDMLKLLKKENTA